MRSVDKRPHADTSAKAAAVSTPAHPSMQEAFRPERGNGFDHSRAYWLALCSNLVYPATAAERQADDLARQAIAERRAIRPGWRSWFTAARTDDYERARLAALDAVTAVAEAEAQRIGDEVGALGFDRFRFFSGISTQCFVAANPEMIIICFRGTESNRPWDIYDDLVALPTRVQQVAGNVHLMFWTALKQVWRDSDSPPLVWPPEDDLHLGEGLVECIREFSDLAAPQPIWISGHSLGGALATLAGARLVGEGIVRAEQIHGIYTYGQPRVADEEFAGTYVLTPRHFRLVHSNDIVPRVPPQSVRRLVGWFRFLLGDANFDAKRGGFGSAFEYRHVGQTVFIDRRGSSTPGLDGWLLAAARAWSRINALVQANSLIERFAPGLTDHAMAGYVRALAVYPPPQVSNLAGFRIVLRSFRSIASDGNPDNMADVSSAHASDTLPMTDTADAGKPHDESPHSVETSGHMLDIYSSTGLGLLVGLLMGLAVSPTVGLVVGGLASTLALLLGLNDRHFSRAKAIRIGTFGFVCVVGALLGMLARTHQVFAPSLSDQLSEYTDAGYTEEEARDFIKLTRFGVRNTDKQVAAATVSQARQDGSETFAAATLNQSITSGVLFNADINASTCTLLRARSGPELADQWFLLGGSWNRLATRIEDDFGQGSAASLAALTAIRDGVCGAEGSEPASFAECASLSDLEDTADPALAATLLRSAGPGWQQLQTSIEQMVSAEHQTRVGVIFKQEICDAPPGT